MSIPPLNYDVLDVVFGFIPANEALRFSTVSSRIYGIALRRALVSVRLKDFQKTLQFCAFILSHGSSRISLLRGLEILEGAFKVKRSLNDQYNESFLGDMDDDGNLRDGEYNFSLATILASILFQAQGLTYLHISGAESIFQGSPLLADAIAGLRALQTLELEDVGVRTRTLLRRLQCDVRDLGLKFGTCALDDLSGFRSLQCLRLFRMRVFSSSGTENKPVAWRWPSVRSLQVGYVTASLATFMNAFPNVRILNASEVVEPLDQVDVQDLELSPWWKLDHLIVCVGDRQRRWRIPNSVTTHRLSVVNSISALSPDIAPSPSRNQQALEIVGNTIPFALSLSICTEVGGQFWIDLAEASNGLKHLEINLLAARGTPAIMGWMLDVLPHMKTLPIEALMVSLQRPPMDETAPLPVPGDVKFHELGMAIASTIPSLRCLSLRSASSSCSDLHRHTLGNHDHELWFVTRDEHSGILKLCTMFPDSELCRAPMEKNFEYLHTTSECL